MDNKLVSFPKNFWWGAATSAEQSEGRIGIRKAKTIYDLHFEARPEDFYDGVGPSVTCDTIHNFETDVEMMAEMKFNTFRTSISWARIFPDGMSSPPNSEAVNWYHDYFRLCKRKGISVIATLHHFDVPVYEWEKGGWKSLEVIDDFAKYAEFIFEEFYEDVDSFVTFNEPHGPAKDGYLLGRHWPLIRGDLSGFIDVSFGITLAHAKAVNIFNRKYHNGRVKIGIILDVRHSYPLSSDPGDKRAARISELLFYYWVADPMISGWFDDEVFALLESLKIWPKLATKKNLNEIARIRLDYAGVNFYGPLRAKRVATPSENHLYKNLFDFEIPKNARVNHHRGIEIYPEALADVMRDIWNRHGIPVACTENGIGIEEGGANRNAAGEISDAYRIAFIEEHLIQLRKLLDEGVNVFGYHLWASIDCWSWINAFKNRYGLIEVDVATMKRRLKESGHWFANLASNNGFIPTGKKVEDFLDFKEGTYQKSA